MLADLEWNNPHHRPGGKSLQEWVEGVRWLERNGWLRDPETLPDAARRRAGQSPADVVAERLCHALCWRPRCRRARRCRHVMPLAVRDWQPEFALGLAELLGLPCSYQGPHDAAKLALFKRYVTGELARQGEGEEPPPP